MATRLLSDCSSNWVRWLMMIYISINIGFLNRLKKLVLVSYFIPIALGPYSGYELYNHLVVVLFLIWWSNVYMMSIYHLPMANYLHFVDHVLLSQKSKMWSDKIWPTIGKLVYRTSCMFVAPGPKKIGWMNLKLQFLKMLD